MPCPIDLSRLGLFIARDGTDGVDPGVVFSNSEAGQTNVGKSIGQVIEGLASRRDNQNPLACHDHCGQGIDSGLQVSATRHCFDCKALAGDRARNHPLLNGVGVRDQKRLCNLDGLKLDGLRSVCARSESFQNGGLSLGEACLKLDWRGREICNYEKSRGAQGNRHVDLRNLVEHGDRKQVIALRRSSKDAAGVERYPEVVFESLHKPWIHSGAADNRNLKVVRLGGQLDRPEQQRHRQVAILGCKRDEPTGQENAVDSRGCANAIGLCLDALGGGKRARKSQRVSHEIAQRGRARRDKLRHATWVCALQINLPKDVRLEINQRVGQTDCADFLQQDIPVDGTKSAF